MEPYRLALVTSVAVVLAASSTACSQGPAADRSPPDAQQSANLNSATPPPPATREALVDPSLDPATQQPIGGIPLVQQSGTGSARLTVRIPPAGKNLLIRWNCLGSGLVSISDGAGVSTTGACGPTSSVIYNATVDLSKTRSPMQWRLSAGQSTTWRIVFIADADVNATS